MPSASSSAMCLSRATGSRPVQPAITAWSIARVSGVVVSCASIVKVRSNTDRSLDARRQLEQGTVVAACRGQHQPYRDLSLAMRGQRDGAAVDHVDQRTVAQCPHVLPREGAVVGKI